MRNGKRFLCEAHLQQVLPGNAIRQSVMSNLLQKISGAGWQWLNKAAEEPSSSQLLGCSRQQGREQVIDGSSLHTHREKRVSQHRLRLQGLSTAAGNNQSNLF